MPPPIAVKKLCVFCLLIRSLVCALFVLFVLFVLFELFVFMFIGCINIDNIFIKKEYECVFCRIFPFTLNYFIIRNQE